MTNPQFHHLVRAMRIAQQLASKIPRDQAVMQEAVRLEALVDKALAEEEADRIRDGVLAIHCDWPT